MAQEDSDMAREGSVMAQEEGDMVPEDGGIEKEVCTINLFHFLTYNFLTPPASFDRLRTGAATSPKSGEELLVD